MCIRDSYSVAAPQSYQDGSSVYVASSATNRQNTDPYYAVFGNATPPAAQQTLFPQQTGATAVGAQGFAWRDVIIDKSGDSIIWSIDGTRIATIDLTTFSFAGGNILFNQYDINATVSTDPNA